MNKSLIHLTERGYALLARAASALQSVVLLVIRLYWGWQFFNTGRGKLSDLDKVTDYFSSLHLPLPRLNAFMAGSTECVCGMLLLLGLGSRLITIPLIVTMIVAYMTADSDRLQVIFSEPDKFLTADEFLFLFASVLVFVFGPGLFSVDAVIQRFFLKKPAPTAMSSAAATIKA